MDFYEVLDQVLTLLQRHVRVTYRALKLQFKLDDETLEALKEELLFAHPVIDEEGRGLVWSDEADSTPKPDSHEVPHTPVEPPPSEPRSTEAERRQLTVMFCDLVDSTALSGQLDPEDLREVIQAYQATVTEVVQRYEGHIAQYLGDGLLVYFGWPLAHEDDAQRAVYTGLGIPEAIALLNPRLEAAYGVQLAVRIGIHTGPVVVGKMGGSGRHENLALGETPNISARIQGLAAPDTAAISRSTYQLVVYPASADNDSRPLASRLKSVNQPVISTRNPFLTLRPRLLAHI